MFKKKAASGAVLRAVGEQVQRHGTTQQGSSSSSRSTTATTAAVKPQQHSATKTTTAAAAAARDATRLRAVLRAHTAPSALLSSSASLLHDESFAQILESVRQSTASYTDLDEVLQTAAPPPPRPQQQQQQQQQQPSTRGASPRTLPAPLPAIVTFRTYMASLTCAKKFYLTQHRSDLLPRSAISDLVHYDDTVGFNELARRWDRLQFGSKAVTVHESNFAEAVQRTEQLVTTYFNTTYASLREQAPPLTLHRPAFEAPFGVDDDNSGDESSSGRATQPVMVLRARPCVLRFRPQDNQWVLLEASATIDPTSTTAKTAATLQRLHFSAVVFRHWVTQPHIPIALRKRFLQLDLDGINAENAAGHVLERSARIATPIDLKRSGLLHIRQFFPGPATLLDCDPTRLVKFVHRLSLEELLLRDRDTHRHPANAFDLPFLPGLDPRVLRLLTHPAAAPHGSGGSSSSLEAAVSAATTAAAAMSTTHTRSSSSSARQREHDEHRWFDVQQQLMEALLRHHTLPLVHRARNAAQAARWSAFARDCRDGTVCSAYDAAAAAAAQEQQQQQQQQAAATQKSGRRGRKSKAEASPSPSSSAATSPEALTLCTVPPTYSEHLGVHCSRGDVCPFFAEGLCLPQRVHDAVAASDNHLFTLPSSSMSRKVVWWREGLRTIRDVLYQHKRGTLALTAPQLRYVKAVAEGCIALNPHEIDAFFDRLRYPVFVIDFEAVQFALPPFTREVAYQSVPFQFSLDVFQRDVLTETPRHYDFLHFGKGYSPNDDPRKACIDELMRIVRREREVKRRSMEDSGELARLRAAEEAEAAAAAAAAGGGSGKRRGRPAKAPKAPKITRNNPPEGPATPYDGCFIAHFASFEKTCLEKLGQLEEQYKNDIKAFYFLDTMELIKRGFIHPNAHGSNSLKKVLPALCPEFQYGVFGTDEYSDGSGSSSSSSSGSGAAAEDVATSAGGGSSSGGGGGGVQDVQRGDNAMGLYRLWYHQEGGGTIQELQRSRAALHGAVARSVPPASQLAMHAGVPPELREAAWAKLRIQLLEYCSLDTRGLYEIMREMWRERDAARGVAPADKTGWVYVKPTPREVSL